MQWRFILNIIGILILFLGASMIFPLFFGLYYHDQSILPLSLAMGITIAAGLLLILFFKDAKVESISHR